MSKLDLSRTDIRLLTSNDLEAIQLDNVEALKDKSRQMKTVIIIMGAVLVTCLVAQIYNEAKRRQEIDFPYKY